MIVSSPALGADPVAVGALLSLQRSAYALEARLVGDDRLPPLHEDEHAVASFAGRWLTAWDGTDLLGALAWTDDGTTAELVKVMVSPAVVRQGVGSALVTRVLGESRARRVVVATGRDNGPAVGLYRRHGFRHEHDVRAPTGLWISRFVLERRGDG